MLPPWSDATSAVGRDYAACRALIRQGSRSFFAASLLLPRDVRMPACALYAFCRLSDDAVDGPNARRDAIALLRDRLDRVYAGKPAPIAADRAFADVVARFDLPKALPSALIDGLEWDAQGRRCANLSELFAYSARVAAAVGAMMTVLMGVRDAAVLARACDLGVAMQLTNIARDIGEDARNGRIYLPLDWLAEAGVDVDGFLARPVFDMRIGGLVARLLDEAEALYRRSASGVAGLPLPCRPAIHAARLIYREIGEDVRRAGHDSVSRRAVVSDARKLGLLASAIAATQWTGSASGEPPLAETRFLVEAVPPGNAVAGWTLIGAALRAPVSAATRIERRFGRMVEIMGSLEGRRDDERHQSREMSDRTTIAGV